MEMPWKCDTKRAMRPPLLITGTDTGIGKTRVACALLRALRVRGLRAAGMKPVASGCTRTPEGWRNADALALQAASDPAPAYLDINPYPLPLSTAPQLAARAAGVEVQVDVLDAALARLAAQSDQVVIEGAGGWAAPLADGLEHAQLAQRWQAGVVLVVGLRLGCLNHARLSARAIEADGLHLHGWVGNRIEADVPSGYLELVRAALPVPCLGVLAHDPAQPAADAAVALDIETLTG